METTTTKMKFKKGDEVIVIAGKDKGKVGTIAKVSPGTNRVLITGVNLVKRAVKPNPQTGEEGGIIAKESPIHASNVAFNSGGKPSRKRPA